MASLNQHTGLLGVNLAKHLLRRACYNITKSRIDTFAGLTAELALDRLLDYTLPNDPNDPDSLNLPEPMAYDPDNLGNPGTPFVNSGSTELPGFTLNRIISGWYLDEARRSTTLRFKLATFLHSIFIVDVQARSKNFYDYVLSMIYYSKKSYKELAYKITYNNRMLAYLSGRYSSKDAPNEDYAREFLELFTITKGPQAGEGNYTNYTELDVQEAAKLLTGFRQQNDRSVIDPDSGIPTGITDFSRHDTDDKTFSSAFNGHTITGAVDGPDMFRELQDFVDMIFAQEETAKVICRRMYRYFVRRNIDDEVENDIIEPLANILRDNDYEIEITIRTLLSSQHFFDQDDAVFSDEIIGALIKTPIDLLLQSFNLLDVATPDPTNKPHDSYLSYVVSRNRFMKYSEMYIFAPINVAGYKAIYQEPDYDKQWFNFNTIDTRFSIGKSILKKKQYFQPGNPNWKISFDLVLFVKNSGNFSDPKNAPTFISEVYNLLLIESPESFRHDYFYNEIFLKTLSAINWKFEWINYIDSGDDTSVRGHLEDLFDAIMGSPEYQVL